MFSSCFKSIEVWKRLASESFSELGIDVDIDELMKDGDGTVGNIERGCVCVCVGMYIRLIKSCTSVVV